ncbi:hypothetical protein DFS33DRAFT_496530 [Desarmillaria ectypa]|nr:hypothetical protein DFS33DRAFT_496530 [Desarmillaria ectypa]
MHMAQYFSFIAARMPHLELLHVDVIRHQDLDISLLSSALKPFVSKLTSLKSIRFPPFVNAFFILSVTSTLPHITTILVEDSPSYPVHTPSLPSGLPCTLPSHLGTLHVSMTFGDAMRLFHTDLPHLLDILLDSGQCEAPPTVHRLTTVISQSCCNVPPLFSCSAMEEFTIEHAFPLLLQTFLTRCPALKVLYLNSSHFSPLPPGIDLPLPEWKTLATDAYPFAQLNRLSVGTHNEARLLGYILPPGCTIIPVPMRTTCVT